jgi:Cu/Ag efflux pump CusA
VLGGLVTGTLLSLLVIPVVYTLVDDTTGLLRRLAPRRRAAATR